MDSQPPVLSYEPRKRLRAWDYVNACATAVVWFILMCLVVAVLRFLLLGVDGDEAFGPVGHAVDAVVCLGVPTCVAIHQYFVVLRACRSVRGRKKSIDVG